MPAKAKQAPEPLPLPVVLFGLDPDGKPLAARFSRSQAVIASKAAVQLKLRVLPVQGPELISLAERLPSGRLHASGRGLVQNVRRDLFNRLLAMAGPVEAGATAATPSSPAKRSAAQPQRIPPSWKEIGAGDLVIAQEGKEEGWYDAVVVEVHDDMLILRWHNWSRDRRFSRHRYSVALMHPDALASEAGKPAASVSKPTGKSGGASATSKDEGASVPLPSSWLEIGVGSLVLAREEGPMCGWWEAIPTEVDGDNIRLRWRDYALAPHVCRLRQALALLHPNGSTPSA